VIGEGLLTEPHSPRPGDPDGRRSPDRAQLASVPDGRRSPDRAQLASVWRPSATKQS